LYSIRLDTIIAHMYGTYRSTISIDLPLNQEDHYNKTARRINTLYYRNIALRKNPSYM